MCNAELPHVRTELLPLLVIPLPPPHPEQPDRQLACHSDLGSGVIAADSQVRVLPAPGIIDASGTQRGLAQQETEQSVALLADVTQTPVLRAGVLTRNQSQITAYLLAAAEPIRRAEHEHVS